MDLAKLGNTFSGGEKAHLVKYLPLKHENLSSGPLGPTLKHHMHQCVLVLWSGEVLGSDPSAKHTHKGTLGKTLRGQFAHSCFPGGW